MFRLFFIFLLFFQLPLHAQAELDFKLGGFLTVGGAYNDNKEFIFIDNKDDKKGALGGFSTTTDTKVGLQLDAYYKDNISLTIQGIANQIDEHGGNVFLEWANIKYNANDVTSLRIGKMRAPLSLYSDVLNTSYAYSWVRLPREVYSVLPFSNYNGAELEYSFFTKNLDFTLNLLYGNNKKNIFIESSQKNFSNLHVNKIAGIVINTNYENLRLMTSYFKIKFDVSKTMQINPNKTNVVDLIKDMSLISTGFMYNLDNSFFVGEYIYSKVENTTGGFRGYYLGVGHNFDKFTPYVMYSKRKPESEGHISSDYVGLSNLIHASKSTYTFGLRYDFIEGGALKLQYDYVDYIDLSQNEFDSTKQNVFSLTFDFVF